MTAILETRGLGKSFAGAQALQGVDFRVRAGEIHALLGHNGAGKSTLVKILNGVYPEGTYEGEILLGGEPVRFASTTDARHRGIGYVPQEIQVIPHLTIAENIFIGQMGLDGRGAGRGVVRFRDVYARARTLLELLDIDLDPRAPVSSLSAAQRHLVMVARALAASPSVLMLDEPTASLSGEETDRLFAVLRRLHDQGMTMVFITHRLPEVVAICDSATVLRDGRIVAELERDGFDEERIVSAMVGRRVELVYPARKGAASPEVALAVERLRISRPGGASDVIHDVSFELRRGEVLGIAGLLGSGRTEVLSAIYGRISHDGTVLVEGRPVAMRRPADARRAGIVMLTEDRKHEGLLFNLPLGDNITIGNLGQVSRGGLIDRGRERETALTYMRMLNVRAPSAEVDVAHLSGGNQQKLLFARVLMNRPKVLLLDEPTKGVDVETRQEIYRLVVDLADQGLAILLVSSEIPELLGLCDRCVVLVDGTIGDEFSRSEGSEERVVRATTTAARRPRATA